MLKKKYLIGIFAVILIGLTCAGCYKNKTELDMQDALEKVGLAGTIKIQSTDSKEYLKIYSCFRENEAIYATIEIRVSKMVTKENIENLFDIIDENGEICEYLIEEFIEQGEKRLVVVKFLNDVAEAESERYDLIYEGNTLPIVFSKLDVEDPQATIKNLDSKNGVTIAAFPYYNDEQVATVTVVVTSSDGNVLTGNIADATVSVHDNAGKKYDVNINGDTVEIANAMFSDGLIMEITDFHRNDLLNKSEEVWILSLKY